jgi:thioredoxin-related protein
MSFIVLIVSMCLFGGYAYAEQATQINVSTLEGVTTSVNVPGKAIALFAMPGCSFCEMFQPLLVEAMERVKPQDDIVWLVIGWGDPKQIKESVSPLLAKMAQIYVASQDTLKVANVTGFPTLVLYENGSAQTIQRRCPPNLTGSMLAKSILSHIKK